MLFSNRSQQYKVLRQIWQALLEAEKYLHILVIHANDFSNTGAKFSKHLGLFLFEFYHETLLGLKDLTVSFPHAFSENPIEFERNGCPITTFGHDNSALPVIFEKVSGCEGGFWNLRCRTSHIPCISNCSIKLDSASCSSYIDRSSRFTRIGHAGMAKQPVD